MPTDGFDWAAEAYLAVRRGETDGRQYMYADGLGTCSFPALIRYLIYDFHALMNHELTYSFIPATAGVRPAGGMDEGAGSIF